MFGGWPAKQPYKTQEKIQTKDICKSYNDRLGSFIYFLNLITLHNGLMSFLVFTHCPVHV